MSSSAYNFFGAEHTITIPEQLNAGRPLPDARRLLRLRRQRHRPHEPRRRRRPQGTREGARQGRGAHELDRLGALTGHRRHLGQEAGRLLLPRLLRARRGEGGRRLRAASATSSTATSPRSSSSTSRTTSSRRTCKQALDDAGLLRPRLDPEAGRRSSTADAARHRRARRTRRPPRTAPADRDQREARRRDDVAARHVLPVPGDARSRSRRSRTSTARRTGAGPASHCFSSTTGSAPTVRRTRRRPARSTRRRR